MFHHAKSRQRDSALVDALARAKSLESDLDRVLGAFRTLVHRIGTDVDRVCDYRFRPGNEDEELDLTLIHACHRVRDLARELEDARDFDSDRARHCTRELDLLLAHARDLGLGRSSDLDFNRTRYLVRHLSEGLNSGRDLARELAHARDLAKQLIEANQQPQSAASPLRVSVLAGRASDAAARLLPRVDQARYTEEYRSDLFELAQVSRRAQWAYAARLLACAVPLRRELRRRAREAAGR